MILMTILVFVIILGLLIFVHELGHFVMAKRAGMHVQEFGFGFPPRLFGIRRGETVYSINWIPLGGFVKIAGEDGGDLADPRAFGNKSFWRRFGVIIAGVAMNMIFAWFLIFLGLWAFGTPMDLTDVPADLLRNSSVREAKISIVAVEPGSPAEQAGFRMGDAILSVDGQKFEEIEPLIAYSRSRAGQSIHYEFQRGQEIVSRDVTPRVNPPEGSGPVGFAPAKVALVSYPFFSSLGLALQGLYNKTIAILLAFGALFGHLFATGKVMEGLSGPVGIAVLTRDFTRLGFAYLIQFAATLSINLAIINAFPFPALDGGRILFLIIEKIRGVKSVKWERIANTAGFLFLLLLMVAVTWRDIGRNLEQFKRLFERII